ncbi:type VI secretion system Vgr family protein [Tundrisphaera sp. TA3]|uniref:type VI secretion system Vgr family protein n=1 Tax=Tundrisphaera sp. TA3 TaxID=3435775 RepID=UPI003EBCC59A
MADDTRGIPFLQANRPIAVMSPLGPDVLLLAGFRGSEAISRPFRFELDLMADNRLDIGFDQLIGADLTFRMILPDGTWRYFNGICSRLAQGERDKTFTRYEAEVVPRVWFLEKVARSRTFQYLSVPEILGQVFAGFKVAFHLEGTYHPRVFCVQYRETDFAFASRLMEDEGISYYFRHEVESEATDPDGHASFSADHTLVIVDRPRGFLDLPEPGRRVTFEEVVGASGGDGGGSRDEGRVRSWTKAQELRSGKISLRDSHFELPRDTLEAEALTPELVRVGQVDHRLKLDANGRLELYDFPGGYARRFDGIDAGGADRGGELAKIYEDARRVAALRMLREASLAISIEGEGNCRQFSAGFRFELERHFNGDGAYLLTEVEHVATLGDTYRSGGDADLTYQNRFACLPAALPFCPPRETPRPRIDGTQTALVTGSTARQAYLDRLGRIKVLFPWDREGNRGGGSSCWVRVAQPWAGNGWGAFFWPRIGHEVVVTFEEGDPDRPLVIGSVYNAENLPPFRPSSDPMVNGIKSCSEFGDPLGKFNGIVFYDEQGDEHTQVHSQKFALSTNETAQCTQVGKNRVSIVGGLKKSGAGSGSGGAGDDEDEDIRDLIDDGPGADGAGMADGAATGKGGLGGPPAGVVQSILEGLGWDDNAAGGWATDLGVGYGEARDATVGMRHDDRVGGHASYHLDPFGWSAELDRDDSLNARETRYGDLEALGSMIGKNEVKLAAEGAFHFGRHVGVRRGQTTTLDSPIDPGSPAADAAEQSVLLRMLFLTLAGSSTADALDYKKGQWAVDGKTSQDTIKTLIGLETLEAIRANIRSKSDDLQSANELIQKSRMQPDPNAEVGKFLAGMIGYLDVKSDEVIALEQESR